MGAEKSVWKRDLVPRTLRPHLVFVTWPFYVIFTALYIWWQIVADPPTLMWCLGIAAGVAGATANSLTLNGSYNHSPWVIEGEVPSVGTLPTAPEYDYGSMVEEQTTKSATFTLDWTPSDRLLVSGFAGLFFLASSWTSKRCAFFFFLVLDRIRVELPVVS